MRATSHELSEEEDRLAEVVDLATVRIRKRFGLPVRGLPRPAMDRTSEVAGVVPLDPGRIARAARRFDTGPEAA